MNDVISSAGNNNYNGLSEHLLGNNNNNNNNVVSWLGGNNDDEEQQQVTPLTQADTSPIDPAAAVEGGHAQPTRLRDAWAALLFLTKQGFVLYLALGWGYPALFYPPDIDGEDDTDAADTTMASSSSSTWLTGSTLTLLVGTSLSSLTLGVCLTWIMTRVAEHVLQGALGGTVVCQGALAVYLAWQGSWVGCGVCAATGLVTTLYARAVWRRIPAAAAQLRTSCQALQENGSVLVFALFMSILLGLWISVVWTLALYGVYAHQQQHLTWWTVALLVLSLFWTQQVTANIVHVTTAGTVGTWWFCPDEANRFWSPAVRDSAARSVTYSLGSICVGSLLVAVMHVLHTVARAAARDKRRPTTAAASMVVCVVQCLVRCTERLLQYFNKWAFVYVGLYGYDYLTAGQKVITLFQERGWTNIIQDDLIWRCLQLVTLALGCLTGVIAMALADLHPTWMADTWRYDEGSGDVSKTAWSVVFAVGFGVGTAVGHLLLGVVASAVNTVLVTWAEAPLELERHYPGLYAAQVAAWRQAYPQEFGM